MSKAYIIIVVCLLALSCTAVVAQDSHGKPAPKPLFSDPVYDGAADPVVIWNAGKKRWWMFYTNRRANLPDSTVQWVHGTRIGIAESRDGAAWTYLDTAAIDYHPDSAATFWAPEVIAHNGSYHMYLTYVPGIFKDWNHPRYIVHLASKDLLHWSFVSRLSLANDKVIDACVVRLPGGGWRMWYNNERDGKSIWYADSRDLQNWEDKGKAVAARGEGPKVFYWKGSWWMIVDAWKGLEVYRSSDLSNWTAQGRRLLESGGMGKDDGAMGGHCDVVVSDDRAFLFYFTHPGRTKVAPVPAGSTASKRSVIQVAELSLNDGSLSCNRDTTTYIRLQPDINR